MLLLLLSFRSEAGPTKKKTKELGKDPPEGSKPENRSVLINNNKSSI
jgi:hypothetical protein